MANCVEVGVTYSAIWRAGWPESAADSLGIITKQIFTTENIEPRHLFEEAFGFVARARDD